MKIGVSLPDKLVAFADEAARRRRTSQSGLLARLLEAERVHQQTPEYLDRYGWDVVEDEAAWRKYQRRPVAEECPDGFARPERSNPKVRPGTSRIEPTV